MTDGPLIRAIKTLALARFTFDLTVTRWLQGLRGQPPYVLRGSCVACGQCCETPMIHVAGFLYHFRSIRWTVLAWHRRVNGFELIGEEKKEHTLVFRCTHWDPLTKKCDSYSSRPGFCRDYPRLHLYSSRGSLLEGCGYRPVHRKAAAIRRGLDKLELSEEKRRELEERLRATE